MRQVGEAAHLDIENVGGIDETEVTLEPGVTVLAGRNATNRTSLLRGLMAALGSDDVSLKGDADAGRVELRIGPDTYTRTLEQQGSIVALDGDPYLDDPTLADLFAFLLGSNEARLAVARGDDLHEIMMRPVDTDAIEAEIDRLQAERDDIDGELAAIDEAKGRLPDLESERTDLDDRIAEKREELEAVESELDAADADLERSREEKQELEEKLDELRSRRSDLEDVRYRIDTERESIESLRSELADLRAELDDLSETPDGELQRAEAELERLRGEKSELEGEITDLQNVIQFNEEVLSSDGSIAIPAEAAGSDRAVTDELLPEDETDVVCWTCGSQVERGRIEETIDNLRTRLEEHLDESREVESRIDKLTDRRDELREHRDRRREVERKIDGIEDEIQDRQERVGELTDQRESLTGDVEDLEREVDELESNDFEEILELHRQANQIEFELERIEEQREDVESEIASIEARIEEAEDLRDRREEIADELADLRTRVENLERQAVEAFNDQMEAILDVLNYDNIARIWTERTERTVRNGRSKTTETTFDLHVVRETENGTTYEDTVDHLSESEREVTGLVFALAGYLVHDVHETLPFVLLDSLEAIDAKRIVALVDHFREYTDYLVVALLEEDARALDGAGVDARISEF